MGHKLEGIDLVGIFKNTVFCNVFFEIKMELK